MSDLVGSKVGNYVVDGRLGKGGFGEVYKAHHTELQWQACVKIIRPDRSNEEDFAMFASLFRREAQTMAQLDHPHIVRIRDFGTRADDGLAYLVMEYVDSGDLATLLRAAGGSLPLARVKTIARQIALGLDYAHSKNIVHRDLKPENILHYSDERLVIADFGLAKAMEAVRAESRRETTGNITGTLAYMAPEHIQGHVEYRSDLYALGVIVYELLCGRLPFQGNPVQLMYANISQPPPPLRQWNPQIPQAVEAVVLKMLAKAPEQRYQSAMAFIKALQEAWVDQVPANPTASSEDKLTEIGWPGLVVPPQRLPDTPPSLPFSYPGASEIYKDASAADQIAEPTGTFGGAVEQNGEKTSSTPHAYGSTDALRLSLSSASAEQLAPSEDVMDKPGGREDHPVAPFPPVELESRAGSDAQIAGSAGTERQEVQQNEAMDLKPKPAGRLAADISSPLRTLTSHTDTVISVAFGPAGRTLATSSADKTVKLWDLKSGKVLHTLYNHTSPVFSVAFNLVKNILASGSWDKTIKLWDLEQGRERYTLDHSDSIFAVAFSPDGNILASGARDGTIILWDVARIQVSENTRDTHGVKTPSPGEDGESSEEQGLRPIYLLEQMNSVRAVAFSPDGSLLASGSADMTIKLWDVRSGQEVRSYSGHKGPVLAVAFSPDGNILASGSRDKTIKLWDMRSGKLVHTFTGHRDAVYSVAFAPQSASIQAQDKSSAGTERSILSSGIPLVHTLLASSSGDATIKLWDLEHGSKEVTLSGHSFSVNSIAFSPDGTTGRRERQSSGTIDSFRWRLASGSGDQTIKLWDVGSSSMPPAAHT